MNLRHSLFHRKSWLRVFLLIIFCTPFTFLLSVSQPRAQSDQENPPGDQQPFSSLNVRLNSRVIAPPPQLVIKTFPLHNLIVARPVEGPPPQAAIIEDDQRQRIAVLSADPSENWFLYLLEPVALDPWLPALFQCARARQCETDRTPLTGGLACVAICLKEILETVSLNPE